MKQNKSREQTDDTSALELEILAASLLWFMVFVIERF